MKKQNTIAAALLLAATATAGEVEFATIDQACEEALALSALPADMRDRASVYVWRDGSFERTVSSDGGFHCLVQRNHPDAIIPECVTSTGEDSILQGIMARTKLVADGVPDAEAHKRILQLVADGAIESPAAPGVNFMMSAYNRIYTASGEVRDIPPHSMMFAPNADANVIGSTMQDAMATKGFPFVVEAGAHSYMVTMTDKPSDSSGVIAACKGQIEVSSPFHMDGRETQAR